MKPPQELNNLQNGQQIHARFGLEGRANVHWDDWQQTTVFVTRYRHAPDGQVMSVTVQSWQFAPEYDTTDYDPDTRTVTLEVEGRYLQIRIP